MTIEVMINMTSAVSRAMGSIKGTCARIRVRRLDQKFDWLE
jgi:hypothetical protein